ncbi:preprotein translocase subunit SecG [Frischella perrara]|uniref:Protein-export membrane protein SecG n=1 Tax=Frischella perrara TaxID=1267021 RepID=A0A0A7S8N4_FRIPE|nr:protein translocase subunit secG [Frischella perrara]PWV60734.1 protein translocase subunit secG [Frischella perrara]
MYGILIVVYLLIAIAIVGLVLIQKGKGADMGASFGAGASATLFGSAGTGNFLTRTTTILGVLFFVISLVLANIGSKQISNDTFSNIGDGVPVATQEVNDSQQPVTTPDNSTNEQEQVNPTSDIPE